MSDVEYQIFEIDLSSAGSQTIASFAGNLVLADAVDSNGDPALNVKLGVTLGTRDGQAIPLRYNGAVRSKNQRDIQLEWEAQSGVTATLFLSYTDAVTVAPRPFKQIVTSSIGSGLSVDDVTVGTSAVLVLASNATRQKALVQSDQGNSGQIFVGPSGVAATDGIELSPGESLEIDGTTAAVYAISDTAAQTVRVMEAS